MFFHGSCLSVMDRDIIPWSGVFSGKVPVINFISLARNPGNIPPRSPTAPSRFETSVGERRFARNYRLSLDSNCKLVQFKIEKARHSMIGLCVIVIVASLLKNIKSRSE